MEQVQAGLDALATCCTQGSSAVAASWAGTAEMLTAMDQIQRDLATSNTRSRLITSFLQQYELTPQQLAALKVQSNHRASEPEHSMLACTPLLAVSLPSARRA